jgi:hypothetical protein
MSQLVMNIKTLGCKSFTSFIFANEQSGLLQYDSGVAVIDMEDSVIGIYSEEEASRIVVDEDNFRYVVYAVEDDLDMARGRARRVQASLASNQELDDTFYLADSLAISASGKYASLLCGMESCCPQDGVDIDRSDLKKWLMTTEVEDSLQFRTQVFNEFMYSLETAGVFNCGLLEKASVHVRDAVLTHLTKIEGWAMVKHSEPTDSDSDLFLTFLALSYIFSEPTPNTETALEIIHEATDYSLSSLVHQAIVNKNFIALHKAFTRDSVDNYLSYGL